MTQSPFSSHAIKPAIRVYLGGSFDPVHLGHVQMAMTVYERLLPFASEQNRKLHLSLLPNARSPFKTHSTNPKHRLAMLKLAVQDTPLHIDELELWQTPPVYTIDSVRTLHAHYPNDSLIFIMGMDSASSLDRWRDGLELTDYVNLWIFDRVDISTEPVDVKVISQPDAVKRLPIELQAQTTDSVINILKPLKTNDQGHIYIDRRAIASVSSTQIRQLLAAPKRDPSVKSQMSVTSVTPINDIIGSISPNLLDKWLNPAVYHYIMTHQLYSRA
ncbi:nicotinate-nicotinamide nucleotide adenylyltransferase [Psychrobacter sp. DM4]|uniref:nicotinate-nicotinamide nucleotide adenylyltransferase n=1 Tax=Psychrobacter sp. DM4 TaxID=3440637 RepID=UPI003F4F4F42